MSNRVEVVAVAVVLLENVVIVKAVMIAEEHSNNINWYRSDSGSSRIIDCTDSINGIRNSDNNISGISTTVLISANMNVFLVRWVCMPKQLAAKWSNSGQ